MSTAPKSVTIRTYQVGFGDCFLLSFKYSEAVEKHVLIDFGTMALPDDVPKTRMVEIASNIKERTGGKLHAVVATHRHKDHISGFTRKNGKGSGDIIRGLKPDVVIQPWTEHKDLATTASKPKLQRQLKRFGKNAQARVAALANMSDVAERVVAASQHSRHLAKELKQRLAFVGEDNVKNLDAVKNLMTMAPNVYVFTGAESGLKTVLPGVDVDVLGPPTVDQHAKIKRYAKTSEEYWSFQARALRFANGEEVASKGRASMKLLFPRHIRRRGPNFPVECRWLIHHARAVQGEQLLQIVTMLDDVMNNTSVILLFGCGSKRLLFPGDAQIENWEYALTEKKDKYEKLLASVDVYKVGHHGSLNATPKSLWKLFKNRSTASNSKRLRSLMSTLEHQHGHEERDTEVPRRTLVSALKRETQHFSTQQLDENELFKDIELRF